MTCMRDAIKDVDGPSSPFAFSSFRTRITTCYDVRVETGAFFSYQDFACYDETQAFFRPGF